MIGTQPTGAMEGIVISMVAHEGLRVTVDGKPARLAIIDDDGNVITASPFVAREAEAVAINSYREFLKGKGHLRVLSNPLKPEPPAGTPDAAGAPGASGDNDAQNRPSSQ